MTGVGKVRRLDSRALWLQAGVKLGRLSMLKVSTEDNLADIGTRGHDNEKLTKLVDVYNLACLDVEQCPETIAASVITSGTLSIDLRAALAAVAVATTA